MAPLKILICGGGCAGPALAYWLARLGHHVVVVERYPALRAGGAQIDLRAQGIQVIKRMGLLDTIRSKLVDEAGFCLVDSGGNIRGTMPANTSGKGAQAITSEYEIMRGDLVRILHGATQQHSNVEYVFGKTVDRFDQAPTHLTAHFSDGTSAAFDLLVGADGQGSRIRAALQPPNPPDPYRHLGVHIAYFFVPRRASDDHYARSYLAPGGRMVFRRSGPGTRATQVYLLLRHASAGETRELASLARAPVAQQKRFWALRFADAGWEMPRFLEGLETADDFFCHEIVQVRVGSWCRGRVVLLGDAAHAPSPFTAMGTTGSLVGAYVLAGEIGRSCDDVPAALRRYEDRLRPFVDEIQKFHGALLRIAFPVSRWGVAVFYFVAQVLCFLRIPQLVARLSGEEKGGWKLPDYPELEGGELSSPVSGGLVADWLGDERRGQWSNIGRV